MKLQRGFEGFWLGKASEECKGEQNISGRRRDTRIQQHRRLILDSSFRLKCKMYAGKWWPNLAYFGVGCSYLESRDYRVLPQKITRRILNESQTRQDLDSAALLNGWTWSDHREVSWGNATLSDTTERQDKNVKKKNCLSPLGPPALENRLSLSLNPF